MTTAKEALPSCIGYTLIFLFPILFLVGSLLGGIFTFSLTAFVFIILTILENLLPNDKKSLSPTQVELIEKSWTFKAIPLLYLPCQYASLFFGTWIYCSSDMTSFERVGMILSQGLVSAAASLASHELYHKRGMFDRIAGRLMLVTFSQGYFETNHAYVHHMFVATPEDPATARRGDGIYTFIPRSIIYGIKACWDVECQKLIKQVKSPYHFRNPFWIYILAPYAIHQFLVSYFGAEASTFFLGQSAFVIILTEIINYVEHYGMERRLIDGRYENVSIKHSWDTNAGITNYFIFNLGRHSDHHTYPTRPYQVLKKGCDNELPSGYISMILLSIIPGAYQWLMDERVLALRR